MSLCGLIESKNGNIAHLGKKKGGNYMITHFQKVIKNI